MCLVLLVFDDGHTFKKLSIPVGAPQQRIPDPWETDELAARVDLSRATASDQSRLAKGHKLATDEPQLT
jgi:hypothetical protein